MEVILFQKGRCHKLVDMTLGYAEVDRGLDFWQMKFIEIDQAGQSFQAYQS